MPQAGQTPIRVFRSDTAGTAPTTGVSGNILDGEIFVNTVDRRLTIGVGTGAGQTLNDIVPAQPSLGASQARVLSISTDGSGVLTRGWSNFVANPVQSVSQGNNTANGAANPGIVVTGTQTPTVAINTDVVATKTSGAVPLNQGGTGVSAASGIAALNSLAGVSGSTTSGRLLRTDGSTGFTVAQLQYADIGGAAPTWNQNTTGTAALATSIAGGLNGQIHYQTAAGVTAFIPQPSTDGTYTVNLAKSGTSYTVTYSTLGSMAAQAANAVAITGGSISVPSVTLTGTVTNNTDAATKLYVDNAVSTGFSTKQSVVTATTAAISLSGLQTIDGVAVTAGQRVLVKNQGSNVGNGIYTAAAGAWTLVAADSGANSYVFVTNATVGASNRLTGFVASTTGSGTDRAWNLFSTVQDYGVAANGGLALTGTNFKLVDLAADGDVRFLLGTRTAGATTWSLTSTLGVANGGTGTSSFTANSLLKSGATTTSALTVATAGTDYAKGFTATTGILKGDNTAGGHAVAVAGTDYQAPVSATTALLKGNNTAGGIVAATAGTDYAKGFTATSALLKGDNSTGGITGAGAETDYVTPSGTGTLSNKTLNSPTLNGTITYGSGGSTRISFVKEPVSITAGAPAATQSLNLSAANVFLFTSANNTNFSVNLTFSGSSINAQMSTGESLSVAVLTTSGSSFRLTGIQIDGNVQTINWTGGTAPSAGGTSGLTNYSISVIKTADSTYRVIASQSTTS